MVTNAANVLALNSVIAATLNSISVVSLKSASGEFFRKIPTSIEVISSQKKRFTFWLNENEGNGNITGFSLYGNGATTTLGTGTEMASQAVTITKDNTQSLTIEWIVEVVQNG
jgi:hypothetical protein